MLEKAYNRLHNISKIVSCGNKQSSLFGVVRTYFINPTEDERTSTELGSQLSNFLHIEGLTLEGQVVTYTNVTQPIHNLTLIDVFIQRHFT